MCECSGCPHEGEIQCPKCKKWRADDTKGRPCFGDPRVCNACHAKQWHDGWATINKGSDVSIKPIILSDGEQRRYEEGRDI